MAPGTARTAGISSTPRLEERGHDVLTPDLPLHDPEAGFDERVRPALEALDGVDDPLVIVGHSQGTAYSCLLAAERPESLLVYLCPRLNGFEPPAGAPDMFREGFPFPADSPDGTSVWDADAAISAMYPRLPPDTARLARGAHAPDGHGAGRLPARRSSRQPERPHLRRGGRDLPAGLGEVHGARAARASSRSRSPVATSRWPRTPTASPSSSIASRARRRRSPVGLNDRKSGHRSCRSEKR